MASWELLDPESELELHKSRLLNVEEKPFKRITKRLSSISSAVSQATNSSDGASKADKASSTVQLQEELTLDFAAFDSNIARLQFLHNANERERVRYDADKQRILDECQAVRDKNAQLREHLDDARATLAQRKKFDELAEKITSNRLLRPREDQIANLAKLEEECKELERESETYSVTWKERRDQFNRIMEEGMLLRRQIRDEKEEVDRREGMNEGTEDDGDAERAAPTPRNEPSGNATPRPDGEKGDDQDEKDDEDGEGDGEDSKADGTPYAGTPGPDTLQVPSTNYGSRSKTGSREVSPAPTPDEREDIDMDEPAVAASEQEDESAATPAQNEEKMEVDE